MEKILHYVDALRDNGAETIVKEYVSLIDRELFDSVVVVNIQLDSTINTKEVEAAGVKIVPVYKKYGIVQRIWNKINGFWYVPFRLKRIIKNEKPDVIHVHMALLKNIDAIKNSCKGIKLFYTCHSLPERYFGGKNEREYYAAKRLIKNNNLHLVALQNEMKNELDMKFGIDTTAVIHNGIDFMRYSFSPEGREALREKLQIPKDALVIGHVGRFFYAKNHSFLVDVFWEISKITSNAYLLLIGDGDLKISIENRIRELGLTDKVKILSHRDDVPELLNIMDRFVFPSIFEGLGIALIEAQVAGLKCTISESIPKEALVSKDVQILSLNESPHTWAKKIINGPYNNMIINDINQYDMRKEIKKLQNLYMEG